MMTYRVGINIIWPLIEAHLVLVSACRNQSVRSYLIDMFRKIILQGCNYFMDSPPPEPAPVPKATTSKLQLRWSSSQDEVVPKAEWIETLFSPLKEMLVCKFIDIASASLDIVLEVVERHANRLEVGQFYYLLMLLEPVLKQNQ